MSKAISASSMDRRRFLGTTAIGLTGLALMPRHALAAASGSFVPLMSIGFAPALPANGSFVRLASAGSLYLPDPTFLSRGARVTVVGSARGAAHKGETGGVGVDAVMPILGRAPARFRFWGAAETGTSGNLSFTVPVVATSGVNFVARRMKESTKKDEISPTAPAD